MARRVSSFMDRGSAYIPHRWISSLDTIDRPHEKELSNPPKGWKATIVQPLLLSPLPLLPSRLSCLSSILWHTYFRSEKHVGWYTWELLISGSVFVVSCLRIQTNKGQWSHTMRLTTPAFLFPGTSTCLLLLPYITHTRAHTHTHARTPLLFLNPCLSHWPLEPLRFTKHLQTAPL